MIAVVVVFKHAPKFFDIPLFPPPECGWGLVTAVTKENIVKVTLHDFQSWVRKDYPAPTQFSQHTHAQNPAAMQWGSPGHMEKLHVGVLAEPAEVAAVNEDQPQHQVSGRGSFQDESSLIWLQQHDTIPKWELYSWAQRTPRTMRDNKEKNEHFCFNSVSFEVISLFDCRYLEQQ